MTFTRTDDRRCAGTGGPARATGFRIRIGRIAFAAALLAAAGCARERDGGEPPAADTSEAPAAVDPAAVAKEVEDLAAENARLRSRLDKQVPKDPYIVVNTTLNRLFLRRGGETIREATCSTGSNTELVDPEGRRKWFFSTPRGVFSVRNKMVAPTWIKPDWAFVEEGEPVPAARADERYEEGVLGKYGLYFGDGYLIHGTLFQRFLGQSVTHGCIRLGDDDLESVYQAAKVGTKIYIY